MPITPGEPREAIELYKPSVKNKSVVDRIIGEHFTDDPKTLFRVRILAASWFFFLISLILVGPLTALLPMKDEARLGAVIMSIIMSSLLALMILTFRFNGYYRLYANLSVFLGFSGILIASMLSPLPSESPSLILFYVIPLLAVFFLGGIGGAVWVFITLFVYTLLFSLEMMGFEFLEIYDERFTFETTLSSVVLGLVAVLGLVITYEFSNEKLRDERNQKFDRLIFLSEHDELTGLYNRMHFEKEVEKRINALGLDNEKTKLVLIHLDLLGFKPINDELGHKAGDYVLKLTATRIKALLEDRGIAGRQGGDEFVILLEDINKNQDVHDFLKTLKTSIQDKIDFFGHIYNVDASVGVAFFPRDAQDLNTFIREASDAMYHAKKNNDPYVLAQDI